MTQALAAPFKQCAPRDLVYEVKQFQLQHNTVRVIQLIGLPGLLLVAAAALADLAAPLPAGAESVWTRLHSSWGLLLLS